MSPRRESPPDLGTVRSGYRLQLPDEEPPLPLWLLQPQDDDEWAKPRKGGARKSSQAIRDVVASGYATPKTHKSAALESAVAERPKRAPRSRGKAAVMPTKQWEDVGETIRAMREERGLDRYQLASLSGIAVETLRAIENGRRLEPKPETVRKLIGALRGNAS